MLIPESSSDILEEYDIGIREQAKEFEGFEKLEETFDDLVSRVSSIWQMNKYIVINRIDSDDSTDIDTEDLLNETKTISHSTICRNYARLYGRDRI